MTAQHAPHTPPMWRRVLSLPHTRLGWWAVGLAGIFLVLMAVTDINDSLSILGTVVASGGSVWHFLFIIVWSLSGVAGLVVGLIALLLSQERSALVWVAMVAGLPALPLLGFSVLVLADGLAG